MHPLARCIAENLHRRRVEAERRFKIGADERVLDARNFFCEAQSLGLRGARVEEASEPSLQIWRAA